MTKDTGNWEAIEPDQLQIGMTIKIDHRWFDHPFVRRSFQISSEREIGIIREVKLTRVFVDRSKPAKPERDAKAEETGEAGAGPEAGTPEAAAAEAAAAAAAEQTEAQRIKAQRISLEAASARERHTLERAQVLLPALGAGDATGSTLVDEFVDFLVAMLNNSTTPLTLMASAATRNSSKRNLLQASDAVCLAALIGKRMGLKSPQLRMLTQAAATHALGLARMPPNLGDEDPAGGHAGNITFRNYPQLSASILQQCGGFPAEVLRIVREHRERPDGSGFPRGLKGDAIHPLALIIGAVRDFQIRCHNDTSPLLALAWLHKNCREIYGAEIIGHLASVLLIYPVGTHVQLSDGRVARIKSVNEAARTSPVVEVYEDRAALRDWITLDLAQCPGLSIVRALDTSFLPPRMFERAKRAKAGSAPPKPDTADSAATAEKSEPAEVAQASGA